jgi:hypothetical protein
MEQKERKPAPKGCAIASLIFIAALIIGLVYVLTMPEKHTEYNDLSISVRVLADDIIEKQLKYPEGWKYESKRVVQKDSTLYDFQAVILAKNRFGVKGRLNYYLQMRFNGSKSDSYKEAAVDRCYWTITNSRFTE